MASKYMMIVQNITDNITSNKFKISEKLPSEEELMKQFKVSRIVVSNAMRIVADTGLVKRIPGKGTFVISNVLKEKGEISNQPINGFYKVALIIHSVLDDYSIRLVDSLITYAYKHNIIISVFCSHNDAQQEELIIQSILASNYHGILLFPIDQIFYSNTLLDVIKKQFPIALLDRNLERLDCSCIQTDNVLGARMAVSHLLEKGHKKIAFISSSTLSTTSVAERFDGYLWQLRKYNVLLDASLIFTNLTSDSYDKLDEVIKNHSATAFVCINGTDFEILNERIQLSGKKVPEDFSVITFDKPGVFEENDTKLRHTYIQQDVKKIAESAIMLMDRMIHENVCVKEKMLIPPYLVEGKSTKKLKQ